MWVNPSRNPSEVMGVAEHRGNLGAERPHRDLGDGDAAIGTPEPLQVGEAGAQAEDPQGGGCDRPDALGAGRDKGGGHHPCNVGRFRLPG